MIGMLTIGWNELINIYMNRTKFAIGCLIQWYEIEVVEEYINSVIKSIDNYEVNDVLIDLKFSTNQDLEKLEEGRDMNDILSKFNNITSPLSRYQTNISIDSEISTISDYRREFNTEYATLADVLIWGESDLLFPKAAFEILDNLHKLSPSPKYITTFGICKMWDNSWTPLEHPEFTVKPFIENDYDNWWSVKYTMTAKEMEEINSRTTDLEVLQMQNHKFNGCGLIISSEVIKAGVNIPQSVFFVHEDTAFMLMVKRVLGDIPQYVIKNILNVHNRNHPKKRMYVKNEEGTTLNEKRRSNGWYVKANKYSEENCYNLFNPNYTFKSWKDVWK